MSQPTEEQLRKVFATIDKDGNGRLDLDEFIAFTLPKGADDKATVMGVEVAFRMLDLDKSGSIGFEEFKSFILNPPTEIIEKETDDTVLRGIFNRFDENGDGTLSREEIKKTLIAWGKDPGTEEEFEADFKAIDTNGDGVISFEEFKAFVNLESQS